MLSLQSVEDHVQVQRLSWISVPGTRELLESPTGSAGSLSGDCQERERMVELELTVRPIFILMRVFDLNFTVLSPPPLFVVFLYCFLNFCDFWVFFILPSPLILPP